jgi:hypothetical protein
MSLQKIREILSTEDTGDTEIRKEKQNPKLNVLSCKTLSFPYLCIISVLCGKVLFIYKI